MTINLSIPLGTELKPKISVVGVGGAGGNAVNNMITAHLEGVEFVVCNTDAQALANCLTDRKIQLGVSITHGLGAGARPEVGRAAAEEAIDEILDQLQGSHMVFITAGMGGGTGTGAAPVIARAVREQGILTVAVVTKPFHFEGAHRMRLAEQGLAELQQYVDTLIVIPNQNLFRLANEKTSFAEAFRMADQVLHMGVRGVTDLMVMPGLINLDFADIRTVMSEMGKAMMGTGEASGENRAIEAAEAAINNPLLDDVSMKGARAVLINITGGYDMTLYEVDAAANRIREEVDPDANIIFGSAFDSSMEGRMRISVVATGITAPGEQPVTREADRGAEGFVFKTQMHRQQPFPTPGRSAARSIETSPAAQLRTPSGDPALPSFGGPAASEPRPLRPGARQSAPEVRAPSFIERMRSFGFHRTPQARPAAAPAGDEPKVHKPELAEAADIPAFLRRESSDR
ncbi:MAG: cell division protein FtsZ [Geminicoccaceae bacterium]|nr:cell division protein FtsZ [Geminicoccaceae bacterium]